ncbi:MAG: DNA repair protein RadA [Dehalococcoidia bacterium]|nr:DNA repair protein RadA [Dehalococcoidia bacterium]
MTREQARTFYSCQECGAEALRWEGRCPSCGEWNTLAEVPRGLVGERPSWPSSLPETSQELSEVTLEDFPRLALGMGEANRVLGGGLVRGSLVLVGGDPGVGKSTLLLQLSAALAANSGHVLYVSGEESSQQIKLRAERLGIVGKRLHVLAQTDMATILHGLDTLSPTVAVIDSIQSVAFSDQPAGPGTIGQVRECGLAFLRWAKGSGTPTFVTGHVTKEGNLAGPRTLEHMVDVVLYLEGSNLGSYRLLRGEKNRFGATHEVGVFEMRDRGLVEVLNPSEVALASRGRDAVGSVVVPVMEGTRPLLVEIQALTTPSSLPAPRRVANGVDMSRLLMVIAVLVKRAGVHLSGQDIIVNVAGGFRAIEPAVDLGMALALASSLRNTPLLDGMAAVGEIGLGGELRNISQLSRRLTELEHMGFDSCLGPESTFQALEVPPGMRILGAKTLAEGLNLAFSSQRRRSAGKRDVAE